MQKTTNQNYGQIKDGIKPVGDAPAHQGEANRGASAGLGGQAPQVEDEVIQKIRDEIDDCGDYCVDYAYEVDDDDAFEKCIDQCYQEISEKYNVPIEKIEEIVKSMINDEEGYDE
jgi:hypothetical protein